MLLVARALLGCLLPRLLILRCIGSASVLSRRVARTGGSLGIVRTARLGGVALLILRSLLLLLLGRVCACLALGSCTVRVLGTGSVRLRLLAVGR